MNLERINKLIAFLEKDPDDSFSRFALALEYVNISELGKARALFEDIRKKDPGYVGLYYHLGKLYENINEKALALMTYNSGIDIAEELGDDHSASELRQALLELENEA